MKQATSQKDLMYGLLWLVNGWGTVAPIVPDYSQSPVHVFFLGKSWP